MSAWGADRGVAERALMEGRVDDMVRLLGSVPAQDGQAQLLLCRAYYSEELADLAVQACEAAVKTLQGDTQAQMWMGRAYGLKARNSGPFAAMKLARKVKTAFEAAYQADPHSAAAANDLGEFYVGAPSMVGGGLDLASDLADKVSGPLPEAGHRIRAMIAEKQHDYAAAEREFRAATTVANRPEAWVDLGAYYFRRSDGKQAVSALEQAVSLDARHGPPTVDAATLLQENHWGLDRPERWLRQYLAGSAKSDSAPAFHVHTCLALMLKKDGDREGAKIEITKALALASNYEPAQKAMQGL
jgi:tetratricopeptide (TPR) repeat protein